ncbi:alpha/beta hydrolase family protein [Brenneria tiliae]|uniref:alpha/beta hydrolase family protein n=1 Tax=Brenneria tiliae TaxID=2914984 RepID=UPI002014CE79|nr:S9 family peptidase [Brenneria tiliae]MCL2898437.1 S9 family peptidase [Brenneria tiliae]MCL2903021.1 S9 family peptidase [Brenneria tiliae]
MPSSISPDSLLSYRFLSHLTANASGTAAAFVVRRPDRRRDGYVSALHIFDGTAERRLLSRLASPLYAWEDDTHLLAHLAPPARRGGASAVTELYRLDLSGGGRELAVTLPVPLEEFEVLADGQLLCSALLAPADLDLLFGGSPPKNAAADEPSASGYARFERIPFYADGRGFLHNRTRRLFLFNRRQGTATPISPQDFIVDAYAPDSTARVVYFSGQQDSGVRKISDTLWRYDLTDGTLKRLYHGDLDIRRIYPLGDAAIVAATDRAAYGHGQSDDFFLLCDGQLRPLAQPGFMTHNTVSSDCRLTSGVGREVEYNGRIYFPAVRGHQSHLFSLGADGRLADHLTFAGSIDALARLNDRWIAIGLRDQRRQEIYALDGLAPANETGKIARGDALPQTVRLTHINAGDVRAGVRAVVPVHLNFVCGSPDGARQTVDGWVLPPANGESGKKYPAILTIHGGPRAVYGTVFSHEMQYWAHHGYYVLYCNPHGSDGKDDAFADIRGGFGGDDYRDILRFVDLAQQAHPGIDAARIGVTGSSYGGFMTNWIVCHTDRFRAAAAQNGISNWVSLAGTSDIGYHFIPDQTGAQPLLPNVEKAWAQSPLRYAGNIRTPLLFLHSEHDYRCPPEQAYQLFTALKLGGQETRFILFHNESHELSRNGRPANRIARLRALTAWFDAHLKESA